MPCLPLFRTHFGVGVAILRTDLGTGLATDAVHLVGDGHDLALVFLVVVVIAAEHHGDELAVLGDADQLQHVAPPHAAAAAATDALLLIELADEFGRPGAPVGHGDRSEGHAVLLGCRRRPASCAPCPATRRRRPSPAPRP